MYAISMDLVLDLSTVTSKNVDACIFINVNFLKCLYFNPSFAECQVYTLEAA